MFCWIPGHVGILGNELADVADKSAINKIQHSVPYTDVKNSAKRFIFSLWQEFWDLQVNNKLHSVLPFIKSFPVLPVRSADVRLTRLRIGHTRFTHKHLFLCELAPWCDTCDTHCSIHHILISCPDFNSHRNKYFNSTLLTLQDLIGEIPHRNLFSFLRSIGF